MKVFLAVLLLLSTARSYSDSVVPERVVTPLIDLYHPENTETSPGNMLVKQLIFTENGDMVPGDQMVRVPKGLFESLKNSAGGVYEVVNGENVASSVHIGNNLVLTNHHVLTDRGRLPVACGSFRVKARDTDDQFRCKRVLFCSIDLDVCLIEIHPVLKTHRPCRLCRRETYEISLARGPVLRPKRYLKYDDETVLTAIGNTLGLGIHASQGKGLRFFYPDVAFYAPTATGNSGGALLNPEGQLIGISKSGTVLKISSDPVLAFNMAISSVKIIELAQEALKDDPETLSKFNQAIVE